MSVSLQDQQLFAEYAADDAFILNVTSLGLGLRNVVNADENRGKQLAHDFVVLRHIQRSGANRWQLQLDAIPDKGQQQTALAV